MSFKLTPITAVIQKTTKGGVTQPFIKGIRTNKEKEDAVGKLKVSEKILNKNRAKSESSDSSAPQEFRKNSRQEIASRRRRNAVITGGIGIDDGSNGAIEKKEPTRKAHSGSMNIPRFGFGGDGGKIDPSVKNTESAEDKKRRDFTANLKNQKIVKGLEKMTKITGKIGSDLRRKQYDAKGWAYDDTIKKPKAKAKDPVKSKTTTTKNVSKKVTPRKVAKVTKANIKLDKAKSKAEGTLSRKEIRANKQLSKAKLAENSGNDKKADRLKKRAARITARNNKKRTSQASKAIDPNN